MESILQRLIKHGGEEEEDAERDDVEISEESLLLEELIVLTSRQGILLLVEKMGQYLVSEDTILRVKATALLCECVCALEDTDAVLNTQQLETLLDFFLNRYKTDWESALACLRGIKSLLARKSIAAAQLFASQTKAAEICIALLTDHEVAELIQTLRILVFDICLLMATKYKDYSFLAEDWFHGGFQQAMEGERDPRCLLVCLRVLHSIVVEAPYSWGVVEDAFELTNVYFPITFQPPPNDPFGITHADLVDALNQVFLANESMAVCSVPLALDRIKTSSTDDGTVGILARIESLRLVALCAAKFNPEVVLAQHLQELRDGLIGLVMNPDEAELCGEALLVITTIVRVLSSRGIADGRDPLWDAFTLQTLRTCGQSLEASMDSMSAQGASKIICAIAMASEFAFQVVMKGILPLLNKLLAEDTSTKRLACLELIRNLCRCVDNKVAHLKGQGPLDPFAPQLFDMVAAFVRAGHEDTVIISLFLTLKEIACRPTDVLVDVKQIRSVSQQVFNLCMEPIQESASQIKKDVIVVGLVTVRDLEAKAGLDDYLPTCIQTLLQELEHSVEAVDLILQVLPMLLAGQKNAEVVQSVVRFLLADIKHKSQADITLARIARTIPVDMLETISFEEVKFHHEILAVYLERVSMDKNKELVEASLALWDKDAEPVEDKFIPTVLLAMRRDYNGVLQNIVTRLKQDATAWSKSEVLMDVFTCAVNKAPLGEEFDVCMDQILHLDCKEELVRTKIYARAFKALVWRSSNTLADKLGTYLHAQLHSSEAPVAYAACGAFGDVLKIDQGLQAPFARVLGIAKQRTFTKWFRALFDDYESSSVGKNEAVLMACASLAAATPSAILKPSLLSVVLVMVRASSSPAVELKLCALQILKHLLAMVEEEGEFVASDHLNSLIPFLLAFTGKEHAMGTRLDALHCLETLPQLLKYHQLHPFRSVVSNTLARGALDDSKKRVRLQAVKCRERWVLFAAS